MNASIICGYRLTKVLSVVAILILGTIGVANTTMAQDSKDVAWLDVTVKNVKGEIITGASVSATMGNKISHCTTTAGAPCRFSFDQNGRVRLDVQAVGYQGKIAYANVVLAQLKKVVVILDYKIIHG